MRYLTLNEVLRIYEVIMEKSGGLAGVRDMGMLSSCVAQPRMVFNNRELYTTVFEKAAALGFSLISNHPFIDGNKRIGHAAMETFLVLNGYEITASIDEQERLILSVASGEKSRKELGGWIHKYAVRKS
ncbi:MAG TPA: type II toxin-antitoxin system death-on-curing family toxin [Thermodesulfobacteriota bacterium]|nr:type II toxin-antitoxin system death-on-curing family toxin [Thermodesulfobacteriota bacterium]